MAANIVRKDPRELEERQERQEEETGQEEGGSKKDGIGARRTRVPLLQEALPACEAQMQQRQGRARQSAEGRLARDRDSRRRTAPFGPRVHRFARFRC